MSNSREFSSFKSMSTTKGYAEPGLYFGRVGIIESVDFKSLETLTRSFWRGIDPYARITLIPMNGIDVFNEDDSAEMTMPFLLGKKILSFEPYYSDEDGSSFIDVSRDVDGKFGIYKLAEKTRSTMDDEMIATFRKCADEADLDVDSVAGGEWQWVFLIGTTPRSASLVYGTQFPHEMAQTLAEVGDQELLEVVRPLDYGNPLSSSLFGRTIARFTKVKTHQILDLSEHTLRPQLAEADEALQNALESDVGKQIVDELEYTSIDCKGAFYLCPDK